MQRAAALCLAFLLSLAVPAAAQDAVTPKAITGEWTGKLVLDNSAPLLTLVFQVSDSTFAGKVYSDGSLIGEMQDGSRSGSRVHFKLDRYDFTGVITGAGMKVDLIVWNGTTKTLTLTKTPAFESPPRKPISTR